MSLLRATAVKTPTATGILVSVSLPPTTHPIAVGAAVALAALAAVLPVVLVALGTALVEAVICLGTRSGRL